MMKMIPSIQRRLLWLAQASPSSSPPPPSSSSWSSTPHASATGPTTALPLSSLPNLFAIQPVSHNEVEEEAAAGRGRRGRWQPPLSSSPQYSHHHHPLLLLPPPVPCGCCRCRRRPSRDKCLWRSRAPPALAIRQCTGSALPSCHVFLVQVYHYPELGKVFFRT